MPAILRTRSKESSIEQKPASRTRTRSRRDKRSREDDDDDDDDEESDGAYDEVGDDYDEYASRAKLATNRPFEIVAGLPASVDLPNYNSSLTHPQSIKNSGVLYDSLVSSRRTWIQGEMFELYWRRPKKIVSETTPTAVESPTSGAIPLIRDKMQKMCDCVMSGGPHTFKVRLFILKNDKIEQKWQEEQDLKKKEKELKRKNDAEAKRLRMEERKKQQLQKKIAKEQKQQLQKENKAKQKLEQEALKLKRKEQMKKLKEQNKNKQGSPSSSMHDPRMIMNLNLMAQEDPKLNTLMETVAKGLANNSQLEEFKKFIEIAKKRSLEENPVNKRAVVTTVRPPPPSKTKDVADANRLNSITLVKSSKATVAEPDPKKVDGDNAERQQSKKERTITESVQINIKEEEDVKAEGAKAEDVKAEDLKAEDTQKKEGNEVVPKKKRRKNAIKEDKDMQLTAFQQKYVQGAEIILEYLEFTHSRYYLPKKSVVEFLEDTGEILISWIVIHNYKEIEKFKTKKIKAKLKVDQEQNKEDSKQECDMEKEPNFNPLFEDDCPTPLYTPMTMKLSGIHKRFNQIIRNSVSPLEEVVKEMEKILQIGTRLSGYNLWYQLDGYDDEALSESLRFELNEWEHAMRSRRHRR